MHDLQHELLRGRVLSQVTHHAHTMFTVAPNILTHHCIHGGEADAKTTHERPCDNALLTNHEKEGSAAEKQREGERAVSAGQQDDGDEESGADCSHLGAENNVDGVGHSACMRVEEGGESVQRKESGMQVFWPK